MTDTITVTGLVATNPRHIITTQGLAISSFRLASTQRLFDRLTDSWIDGDTNWYTVSSFRGLAESVAKNLKKGDRVIIHGRLRIRDWETSEGRGINVEIECETIGIDIAKS